ncbi:hypothetical protein EIP91_006277 [Steccherinum ochraceum]|uniref:Uncharacterized protein n=1 Tax=Steccherinum ochraceum TaxID=92696 RepID=A0A4R0R5X8_9APHY|nr:hypothetical protein EIP91_006277 [Steccherinum ochraceum]
MTEQQGASNNELLLAAAKDDNKELMDEVLEKGDFDVNSRDGVGNTALHLAAANGSTEVLEDILTCDDCDVDLINNLEKATPLHLALLKLDGETLEYVVYQLIESGADIKIKDKHGRTAVDLAQIKGIRDKVLQWDREAHGPPPPAISNDDVADDDDDDEPGSGSGSE